MVVSRRTAGVRRIRKRKIYKFLWIHAEEFARLTDWWPLAYPDPEYRQSGSSRWQELIEKADQGSTEKLAMEARVRCKDGSFREIEFHLSLVNDLYLVSFVDLTEQKRRWRICEKARAAIGTWSNTARTCWERTGWTAKF